MLLVATSLMQVFFDFLFINITKMYGAGRCLILTYLRILRLWAIISRNSALLLISSVPELMVRVVAASTEDGRLGDWSRALLSDVLYH